MGLHEPCKGKGNIYSKVFVLGFPPVVQWLKFLASNARTMGSIPDQGTKIPHATRHGKKKEKEIKSICVEVSMTYRAGAEWEWSPHKVGYRAE